MLHVKLSAGESAGLVHIRQITERAGAPLSDKAEEMLVGYVEALLRWNEKHNLISRSDTSNIWTRHILHSILALIGFKIPGNLSFIDIGSGGGLPGIPIAILRPDFQGVLVDSIRKKTEALQSIIEVVGITNLSVVTDRVEAPSFVRRFRSVFDLAFARAVAPLPDLVKWSYKILKNSVEASSNGSKSRELRTPALVALKGGDLRNEIAETRRLFPHLSIVEYPVESAGLADEFLADKKIIIVNR